jgi:hypothetical protein
MEERDVLIATTLAQTRTNFDRLYSRHARHYGMPQVALPHKLVPVPGKFWLRSVSSSSRLPVQRLRILPRELMARCGLRRSLARSGASLHEQS